ncbi:MAG: hypothetical protein N2319_13115 [Candidatus Kapabacteria bacterium]|nr:hypothetical protein [Candidatus Kapabacteria bacterium]
MDSSPSAPNDWFLHRLGGRSLRVIKRFLDKQGMTREKEIPVCTGMTGKLGNFTPAEESMLKV